MANATAKEYALKLLSVRPRSVAELRQRLAMRHFTDAAISEAVADLLRAGLLDDAKFAQLWVESRISSKPMGPARLRSELLAKGVDRETIARVLSDKREDLDEQGAALKLARKRWDLLRDLEPQARERR
ncbi:MAG TPA: regulatory protein RecX, partial [Candidatus Edwardsbacteria bacterium]|nr:regulatory protein RecX [Candidatus Edwardsbacteria bacterium]